MRLIFWAAKRLARQPLKPASVNAELTDYRAVLRVWNDNLNQNLALIDTYFGEAARLQLETELFAEYSAIGEELDKFVREVTTTNETPVQVRPIGSRLFELSARVYQFNVFMLRSLRDDDGHAARLPADQHAFEERCGSVTMAPVSAACSACLPTWTC
jgi:hypothetical protein